MGHPSSRALLTAAGVIVTVILAGCQASTSSIKPTTSAARASGLSGVRWTLVKISKGQQVVVVPASLDSWFEISADSKAIGRDGCSTFGGTAEMVGSALTLRDVAIAANGCLPDHGPRDLTREAWKPLLAGQSASTSVVSGTLQVVIADRTLTFSDVPIKPRSDATVAATPTTS